MRRYLWDGAAIPFERTSRAISESERLFARDRYGLWAARVLEKLGFALEGRETVGGLDTLFYEVRR